MNRTRRFLLATLLVGLVGVGLLAQPSYQYVLSHTTLNGAIDATQTTLVLTSAAASGASSNIPAATVGAPSAGQCLFVDHELMRIVSMASTTATITRAPFNASPHATASVIFTGPCALFKTADPVPSGNVTCASQPGPWINVTSGNVWWCGTSGMTASRWYGTNAANFAYNSVPIAQLIVPAETRFARRE